MGGEAEVRNVLNWPTSQDLKTEETFEANKSEHGNSEDDLMEIFNIPKDRLLDPNSPEQLDQVPEEQHDSEDDLHMESLNTPTVIVSGTPCGDVPTCRLFVPNKMSSCRRGTEDSFRPTRH